RFNLGVEVDASGNWSLLLGSWDPSDLGNVKVLASGTDPDLAAGGDLEAGGVGIHGAGVSGVSQLAVHAFIYYTGDTQQTTVDVVRANGLGVLTDQAAYTADSDGSDPAPIADYRGARVWFPPGDSHLAVKLRRTELD